MTMMATTEHICCGNDVRGYYHEAGDCGLVNSIRLDLPHDHFYCPKCLGEHTNLIKEGKPCPQLL